MERGLARISGYIFIFYVLGRLIKKEPQIGRLLRVRVGFHPWIHDLDVVLL